MLTARGMDLNWGLEQSVLCYCWGKLGSLALLLGANSIVLSAKDSNPWREGRHPFPLFFPYSLLGNTVTLEVSLICHEGQMNI